MRRSKNFIRAKLNPLIRADIELIYNTHAEAVRPDSEKSMAREKYVGEQLYREMNFP